MEQVSRAIRERDLEAFVRGQREPWLLGEAFVWFQADLIGVLFSCEGISGVNHSAFAAREQLKVFQDRGVVIVVIDRDGPCRGRARSQSHSSAS